MSKGNTEFKHRVGKAVVRLRSNLGLEEMACDMLRTPYWDGQHFVWTNLMGTDGLLVRRHDVVKGQGVCDQTHEPFWVGVLVQSEFATSDGIPNPFGKAASPLAPNGVWVDTKAHGRVRLGHCHVLLLVPQAQAASQRTRNVTAARNARKAERSFRDCTSLTVPKGDSTDRLVAGLEKKAKELLFI